MKTYAFIALSQQIDGLNHSAGWLLPFSLENLSITDEIFNRTTSKRYFMLFYQLPNVFSKIIPSLIWFEKKELVSFCSDFKHYFSGSNGLVFFNLCDTCLQKERFTIIHINKFCFISCIEKMTGWVKSFYRFQNPFSLILQMALIKWSLKRCLSISLNFFTITNNDFDLCTGNLTSRKVKKSNWLCLCLKYKLNSFKHYWSICVVL